MGEPANDNHWTVADVRRALKAIRSGGESVAAVDFPRSGGFRILLGEPVEIEVTGGSGANDEDQLRAI